MTTPTPRVLVPSGATKGEVFQVKTIISHQMETGLRHDAQGRVIPRKIINRFVCRYGGVRCSVSISTRRFRPTPSSNSICARRRAAGSSSSGRRTAAASIDWHTNSRSLDMARQANATRLMMALSLAASPLVLGRSAEPRGGERSGRSARRDVRRLPPPRRPRPGHPLDHRARREQARRACMAEFKSGERKSQIMRVVALSLSDEEIADRRALSRGATKEIGAAMNCWTRRQFGCLAGAACLTALVPRVARGQAKARVVVIGGGIGGATVARYLAASAGTIDVTLVEPKRRYTTCFFSNLYLAGMRSFESLTHGYESAGATIRHQRRPRYRGDHRSGGKDGRPQERRQAPLRPARARPGHRLQIRRHRGL